jgi:hypothetical protein
MGAVLSNNWTLRSSKFILRPTVSQPILPWTNFKFLASSSSSSPSDERTGIWILLLLLLLLLLMMMMMMIQPTVSRPAFLGVGHPSGAHEQILICSSLSDNCLVLDVGRSPWREDGSVIYSAATLWSDSRRTHNYILLSHFCLSNPGGPGPHIYIYIYIYILQEWGGPVIHPGIGVPFCRFLRFARLRWP